MKNLNKKELELIKYALRNEIETAEDNSYIESKRNNKRAVIRIEKYIEELKAIYKKL